VQIEANIASQANFTTAGQLCLRHRWGRSAATAS